MYSTGRSVIARSRSGVAILVDGEDAEIATLRSQ